ncbi:hypothetical protein CEXT_469421 [Caerostris extrusa]|uniref:Uncharacterized protein n=1 Tax=Caerostris extrusa TaxID=172846 RepID=A0AAV4WQ53_CAEEX|nr:hypothetical protein CEXT_469421 [Caerostris extrusa]
MLLAFQLGNLSARASKRTALSFPYLSEFELFQSLQGGWGWKKRTNAVKGFWLLWRCEVANVSRPALCRRKELKADILAHGSNEVAARAGSAWGLLFQLQGRKGWERRAEVWCWKQGVDRKPREFCAWQMPLV